jgi:hypothetical protein
MNESSVRIYEAIDKLKEASKLVEPHDNKLGICNELYQISQRLKEYAITI